MIEKYSRINKTEPPDSFQVVAAASVSTCAGSGVNKSTALKRPPKVSEFGIKI